MLSAAVAKCLQAGLYMVLHDINLSARYADYIFAMRDGKLVSGGSPEEVITS